MHGTAMPPSRPDVLRRLIVDVLAGGDVVLLADSAEGRALLDQAAGDLEERRSRVCRVDASGPDGFGLGSLLASLRQQSGEHGDTDQVLERDYATLTALDSSCDRIVLLVNDAHRLQPGALRYLDLVCRASADLRLVFAGPPILLEVIDQPQYAGLAARLAHTPLAAPPTGFAAPDRVAAPAPALRPIERAGMAVAMPVATTEATRLAVPRPPPREPEFDADDDTVAPWEFAAAAARPAPGPAPAAPARGPEPRPAPQATHPEGASRPAAAAAFVRPAAIRPMAPRQVRTSNPLRFDLQTAAALGAMAAGVAIYFVWSGQPAKPPSLVLPAPIVQPDAPPNTASNTAVNSAPPALPPSPVSPLQNALTDPPAGKSPTVAVPPAASLPAPAASQAIPAPLPGPAAPRPDSLATAPAAPPPVASTDPSSGSAEPSPRLPVPPKPTRMPRERREPATRFAAPAPAPSRSARAGYPQESQAWYDQVPTPKPTRRRPHRCRHRPRCNGLGATGRPSRTRITAGTGSTARRPISAPTPPGRTGSARSAMANKLSQ